MLLVIAAITLLAGFVVLAWSADRLVAAAASAALHLGLTPLLVGLFVVGFGTSTPELLVSTLAAIEGRPELALGNALGSNIANVGLILGLTLLLTPLPRYGNRERATLTLLVIATFGTPLLLGDLTLGRIEGGVMIAGLVLGMGLIARIGRRDPAAVVPEPVVATMGPVRSAAELLASLVLLLVSARALVWAAVTLAQAAGVSELVIGLTVIAVGTSLPELATAIAAARRRELGMLYGNLIGSNLFNLLAVLGVTALVQPLAVAPLVLFRDVVVMVALTIPLVLLSRGSLAGARPLAATLLTVFVAYQFGLFAFGQGGN